MTINELILKNEKELTEKQQLFMSIHNNIITAGSVIGNGLISLAENLKKMKDEDLFKEAGYKTFEEYSELACGLKRRQAYNYMKVLDVLDKEFVQSNAQLGITKLSLLASLSEEEKETIVETVNVEDSSVSELKAEITKLKSKLKTQQSSSKQEISELKSKLEVLEKEPIKDEKSIKEIEKLKENIKKLNDELKVSNKKVEDTQLKLSELTKENSLNASPILVEFRLKFNALQNSIIEIKNIIPNLPEEKREGCMSALKKVVSELC